MNLFTRIKKFFFKEKSLARRTCPVYLDFSDGSCPHIDGPYCDIVKCATPSGKNYPLIRSQGK